MKKTKKAPKNYLPLIISLIFFIIATSLLFLINYRENKKEAESIYLDDIIAKGNTPNVDAYLDIYAIETLLADSNIYKDLSIYIVSDDKYYYLIALNKELYNKIKESDLDHEPYRIYGKTTTIDANLKKIIMDAYNNDSNTENDITAKDFLGIYGGVYLNTTYKDKTNNNLSIYSTICYVFSLISLLSFLLSKLPKKSKKSKKQK